MTDYERLLGLYKEIDELIKKGVDAYSPNFMDWFTKSKIFLERKYGKDSYAFNALDEYNFKPSVTVISRGSRPQGKDTRGIEKCIKGLTEIKKVFESCLEDMNEDIAEENNMHNISLHKPKIFISHSTLDKEYAKILVELLRKVGLKDNDIFCSSYPGFDVPNKKNIFEYLRDEFRNDGLYVIFLLSKNYYNSPACLNEMGASWVLKKEHLTFLLPKFEFNQIKGAIDPSETAIKLDGDKYEIENRLDQLRDELVNLFELDQQFKVAIWHQDVDTFITQANAIKPQGNLKTGFEVPICNDAVEILKKAAMGKGIIVFREYILKKGLSINGYETTSENTQVIDSWKAALIELKNNELIIKDDSESNSDVRFYHITQKGIEYIKSINI